MSVSSKRWNDILKSGAENGIRTRGPQLGKLMLYRLSYFRIAFRTYFPEGRGKFNQSVNKLQRNLNF